ncbi:MAG: hypothetical protein IT454_03840 [Planctomycetes bacterium]|nr:hypothetical protein [Planctomycetota bacterium]
MLQRTILALAAALAVLASACTATLPRSAEDELRSHVVSADEEGRAIDPVTRDALVAEEFRTRVRAMLEQADLAARAHATDASAVRAPEACHAPGHVHPAGERDVRKLLVHVHGGLNGDHASRQRACEVLADIERDTPENWAYPIFLTWPSGGLGSVWEHLSDLRFGSHWGWMGKLTLPFQLAYDLLQGIARAPNTWWTMATVDLQAAAKVSSDWDFLPTWERAESVMEVLDEEREPAHVHGPGCAEGYSVSLGNYERGAVTHAWHLLSYLVLSPVKYVTTPLFVDGIGKSAWQVMLHRASNTLRPTSEFETVFLGDVAREELRATLDSPASGAFAVFFRELDRFLREQRERDPRVCWEITLVGHSMGAIILNDTLQLFPELPVSNVVYMAPACSIAEAEEALVPFLHSHPAARFYLLTLHPIAEAEELVAYDLPARGSLLEWLDLWYAPPDHALDRRFGKWNNAISALHVFESVRERVSIKAFAVEGDSKPQKHGQFYDGPFWRPAIWRVDGPAHY